MLRPLARVPWSFIALATSEGCDTGSGGSASLVTRSEWMVFEVSPPLARPLCPCCCCSACCCPLPVSPPAPGPRCDRLPRPRCTHHHCLCPLPTSLLLSCAAQPAARPNDHSPDRCDRSQQLGIAVHRRIRRVRECETRRRSSRGAFMLCSPAQPARPPGMHIQRQQPSHLASIRTQMSLTTRSRQDRRIKETPEKFILWAQDTWLNH